MNHIAHRVVGTLRHRVIACHRRRNGHATIARIDVIEHGSMHHRALIALTVMVFSMMAASVAGRNTCPPSLFGANATLWTLNATSLRNLRDTGNPSTRLRLAGLRRHALANASTVLDNLMLGSNSTDDGAIKHWYVITEAPPAHTECMWRRWPAQVLQAPSSPFMANITTWIYLPWDGRYTCVLPHINSMK